MTADGLGNSAERDELSSTRGITPAPHAVQLSYDDFASQCRLLSSLLPHLFTWHPPPSPFHAYGGHLSANRQPLSLGPAGPRPSSALPPEVDVDDLPMQAVGCPTLEVSSEVEASMGGARCIVCDYHCVYSSSYRVPVLLFRAAYADGQPLALEATVDALQRHSDFRAQTLARACDSASAEEVSHSANFPPITAALHPSLGSPFLSLHPCQTSRVMAVVQSMAPFDGCPRLDVLAWLSATGPFVGLHLPFSVALQSEVRKRSVLQTADCGQCSEHACS